MSEQTRLHYTPGEYLKLERTASHRSEFLSRSISTLALATLFSLAGCKAQLKKSDPPQTEPPVPPKVEAATSPVRAPEESWIYLNEEEEVFVKGDALSYKSYRVIRRHKMIVEQGLKPFKVSYATVMKNGKTLAQFEGFYFGVGNSTDFGLFPLLGKSDKQLIVSQTIPRGGRHWVAEFTPQFRVLFDSEQYGETREGISVGDLNKDGIYEISLALTEFYNGFTELSMSETPLPSIIFKYDEKTRAYVPANHLFQNHILEEIRYNIDRFRRYPSKSLLSDTLNILVSYLFAGLENEGWAFFDAEYTRENKEEVKKKVRKILSGHPAYKFIYRQIHTRGSL